MHHQHEAVCGIHTVQDVKMPASNFYSHNMNDSTCQYDWHHAYDQIVQAWNFNLAYASGPIIMLCRPMAWQLEVAISTLILLRYCT